MYQLGRARVEGLETVRFVPGALADHLTSHGGELLEDAQRGSLRWLQAGTTASWAPADSLMGRGLVRSD